MVAVGNYQALLIISNGESQAKNIFLEYQKYEERKFMGNVVFWNILDKFVKFKLISSIKNGQELKITQLGKKILKGEENWLHINPVKYWIGGVNLSIDNLWCWDIKKKTIGRYYYSSALSSLLVVK